MKKKTIRRTIDERYDSFACVVWMFLCFGLYSGLIVAFDASVSNLCMMDDTCMGNGIRMCTEQSLNVRYGWWLCAVLGLPVLFFTLRAVCNAYDVYSTCRVTCHIINT